MYPICLRTAVRRRVRHRIQSSCYMPKASTILTRSNGKTFRRMLTHSSIQSLVSGSWHPKAQWPN